MEFTDEEKEFLKEGWNISYYNISYYEGWNVHLRQKPIDYTGLYYDHEIAEAKKAWYDRQKRKVIFMNSLPNRLLGLTKK